MNDNKVPGENDGQQAATQDNTSVPQTTNNPNAPEKGKVNEIDNNTKLENEPDAGDLNDDD